MNPNRLFLLVSLVCMACGDGAVNHNGNDTTQPHDSGAVKDSQLPAPAAPPDSVKSTPSLKYSPSVSVITGTVEMNTGFVNVPGGDPKSDGRKSYYVIIPEKTMNIVADGIDSLNKAISGIERIELAATVSAMKPYDNKKVKIAGTLFRPDDAHAFTPVYMKVMKIEEVK